MDRLSLGWLGDQEGIQGTRFTPARVVTFQRVNTAEEPGMAEALAPLRPELVETWPELPVQERFEHVREAIFQTLEDLRKLFPERGHLFLAGVVYQALAALQEALEDGRVSWDNPTIEARFLVPWNFEANLPDFDFPKEEELASLEETSAACIRTSWDYIARRSFAEIHDLTRIIHREDGQLEVRLGPSDQEELRELSQEAATRAAMKKARPVIYPMTKLAAETGDLELGPVVAIAPHHLAPAEGLAFYPVLVSLVVSGADKSNHPRTWSREDQRVLWGLLKEPLVSKFYDLTRQVKSKAAAVFGEDGQAPGPAEDWQPAPEKYTDTTPTPAFVAEARVLYAGPTCFDRKAAKLLEGLKIRLPKRLDTIPRLEEARKAEVSRLLEEHGQEAFAKVGGVSSRGPLLVRKRGAKGETVELSREAEEELLATFGNRAFRRTERGREYLVRRVQSRGGHIETGWSWYGSAALATRDGQDQAEAKAQEILEGLDMDLFATPRDRETASQRLRILRAVKAAPAVMETILEHLGGDRANPLEIPAWELRSLLECEADEEEGHLRVLEVLDALRRFDYRLKITPPDRGKPTEAEGSFLLEWSYRGHGSGRHTDGIFRLHVSELFVGSLVVFATTSYRLKDKQAVFFDWSQKLDKAAIGRLDYTRQAASLSPFFDRAQGFTEEQGKLFRHISQELTREGDPASKRMEAERAPGSTEPRVYGPRFCPLLPEGKAFHGALGRHKRNPEAGRKLKGTLVRGTKSGGARTEGLLAVMGRDLPPGRAAVRRLTILQEAVADLVAVTEDAMGGVAAALLEGRWFAAREALEMPEKDLERARFFLFPAADWRERLARDLEKYQAERHERGETPHLVKVTQDRGEYERARAGIAGERVAVDERGAAEPLRLTFRRRRRERGLSQAEVARVFGVSQYLVSQWETGPAPDDEGRVRGKPIPEAMAPLVSRWTETGREPTEEELEAARKGRR